MSYIRAGHKVPTMYQDFKRASILIIILSCTAGYNHFEVAEHLLENGADVNAQDKGGLIPLHNASSYGVSLWS